MSETIIAIICMEWEMFQKVNNEGGRAACQEDFKTFIIMRGAQFMAWDELALESYHQDLLDAQTAGRNLMEEKYARMMERTAPEKYCEFVAYLPTVSKETRDLIQKIVDIQLNWQYEYMKSYNTLASRSRPPARMEDMEEATSFETYLYGELLTYSERTLRLYAKHISYLLEQGKNITLQSLEYTARLYGFTNIRQMEDSIKQA